MLTCTYRYKCHLLVARYLCVRGHAIYLTVNSTSDIMMQFVVKDPAYREEVITSLGRFSEHLSMSLSRQNRSFADI